MRSLKSATREHKLSAPLLALDSPIIFNPTIRKRKRADPYRDRLALSCHSTSLLHGEDQVVVIVV
jgi:hypothetical protein